MFRALRLVAPAALVLLASAAAAQTVPPLTGQVVDTADMLSATTESAVTARLAAFEDSTSTQIAVLTVPALGGGDLEAFATHVFRTWHLGQAGRDNGVLLLVARDDRKLRIEVGYGLEGDLTDARASEIIRTVIVPRMRDGDPDAAVSAGVDAIVASVSGTYRAAAGFREAPGRSGLTPHPLFGTLVAGIALFLLVLYLTVRELILNLSASEGNTAEIAIVSAVLGLFIAAGGVLRTGDLRFVLLAVGVPLAAVGLHMLLEQTLRTPRWRLVRRRAITIRTIRAVRHASLIAAARRHGDSSVVIDGVWCPVPELSTPSSSDSSSSWDSSSSSDSFSGGGGSSGGGGASGSW